MLLDNSPWIVGDILSSVLFPESILRFTPWGIGCAAIFVWDLWNVTVVFSPITLTLLKQIKPQNTRKCHIHNPQPTLTPEKREKNARTKRMEAKTKLHENHTRKF